MTHKQLRLQQPIRFSMKTSPPPVILDYFAAANAARINEASACFAPDARVHDENQDYQGSLAIRDWIEDTTQKYQPQVDVHQLEATDHGYTATGTVSGNFPGSPIPLHYTFTVRENKISQLTIA